MSGADGSVSIDISTLHRTKSSAQRRQLLDRALETQDQDNEALLTKYKQRLDRWAAQEAAAHCLQLPVYSQRAVA